MDTTTLCYTLITIAVSFIVGGFGNIISILIFNDKIFKQPAIVYFQGSCVFNLIIIAFIPAILFFSLWTIDTFTCKTIPAFYIWIVQVQSWIITAGSIDRMISVLKPTKYLFKNKLKFQLTVIAIISIVIFLLMAPNLFYYDAIPSIHNKNITICLYPIEQDLKWVTNYFKISFNLFRSTLPFLIMIVSSIIVAYVVQKSKTRVCSHSNRRQEIHLFISLAALDIFFIIFRLPMFVYLFLISDGISIFNDIYNLCAISALITNVFNFAMMIKFNKVYRKLFFQYIKFKSNRQVSNVLQLS